MIEILLKENYVCLNSSPCVQVLNYKETKLSFLQRKCVQKPNCLPDDDDNPQTATNRRPCFAANKYENADCC